MGSRPYFSLQISQGQAKDFLQNFVDSTGSRPQKDSPAVV
jgi:hypothetical protein